MPLPAVSPVISGHALALTATIIWSTIYILALTLADHFTPMELTFWRWTLAFAAILPFVLKELWAERAAIARHAARLMVVSLIGMVGFSYLLFLAGRTTSAVNLSLLAATAPIFIALISRVVLGERLGGRQVLGLLVAVAGVVALITRGDWAMLLHLSFSRGDIWMLLGALCFGVYSICLRCRPEELTPRVFLATLMGMGMLWSLPFMVWHWLYIKPFALPSLADGLALAHIGVNTSVIGFLCWQEAIARIGVVRTGVVYYTLPFFSCILAMIFLGEELHPAQALGGALIIGGILLPSLQGVRRAAMLAKR